MPSKTAVSKKPTAKAAKAVSIKKVKKTPVLPAVEVEVPSRRPASLLGARTKKAAGAFQKHETDTGSVPVQISLLSKEITELLGHLKRHPKDQDSRLGLLKKVGRRRKLLNYLSRQDEKGYLKLTSDLGLKA